MEEDSPPTLSAQLLDAFALEYLLRKLPSNLTNDEARLKEWGEH